MRELSLFTGAGGGLLGTKLLGWTHIGYVEVNEYCQQVIRARIEDGFLDRAPIFTDVREFVQSGAARQYRGFADVVSGGFPCQDISVAGGGQALTESAADCGQPCGTLFAKFDQKSCSWKTVQLSLIEDSEQSSMIWPDWGSMRNGECLALTPLELRITEPDGGWLPTPSGVNGGRNHVSGRLDEMGGSGNRWRGTEVGKLHLPDFEAWMMGWPEGWQKLTQLETAKFQSWRQQHSNF